MSKNYKSQVGQTMIETLVAIFMLVMGISAALGLAIYAFNSSTSIIKQIVGSGLAREGLEAVKNMRDTNWLQQTSIDTTCYNFPDASQTAQCYTDWLGDSYPAVPFCLNPAGTNLSCPAKSSGPTTYYLGFDSTSASVYYWNLTREGGFSGLNFNDPAASSDWQKYGFYSPGSGIACSNGTSDYCREINLTLDSTAPYNHDVGPMLKVQSWVWWVDKKCPRVDSWSMAQPSCRVEMDMYLTNWKNY